LTRWSLIGTAAWHYELGPIATAVIKGDPAEVDLTVASATDGLVAATQQLVVEPEGLVRGVGGLVSVAGEVIGEIGGQDCCCWLASRTPIPRSKRGNSRTRCTNCGFDDAGRGAEVSAADLALPVLVVSQFTL
jgi:hypothetical protein